jgi:HAD superfamily hydrolase (TIGR01509 family)
MTRTIDLVIFDCDGVLVDSELLSNRNLAQYLSELGMPHTIDESLARYTGLSMTSVKKAIEDTWGSLPSGFEEEYRARNRVSFEQDLEHISGVLEALEMIQVAKCVASSGQLARVRHSLELTGLLDHFGDAVFSANQVSCGKPAPDLFLYAAEQMDISAHSTLVIEDSQAGVQAGIAAGMTVVGFTGGSHIQPGHDTTLRDLGAHHILEHMTGLPDILTALQI